MPDGGEKVCHLGLDVVGVLGVVQKHWSFPGWLVVGPCPGPGGGVTRRVAQTGCVVFAGCSSPLPGFFLRRWARRQDWPSIGAMGARWVRRSSRAPVRRSEPKTALGSHFSQRYTAISAPWFWACHRWQPPQEPGFSVITSARRSISATVKRGRASSAVIAEAPPAQPLARPPSTDQLRAGRPPWLHCRCKAVP